jgi:HEAT repeat protein
MLAFCPTCWNEITNSPSFCRKCGVSVDFCSPEYERRLLELVPLSHAAKRAEICLLLGRRAKQSAVPHLATLLCTDPEHLVRMAALRALGEIGDASAFREIAKVAANEESPVYAVANDMLRNLKGPR